jgi:hypothetical protein
MARRRYRAIVLLSAMALSAPWCTRATAQELEARGELARVLERADLPTESKALVRQKAIEAMRAGVAERDVVDLVQRGVGRSVHAPDLVRLLDVVTQAKRQELPTEPVMDKMREGLAKQVPPDRIVTVAARVSGTLATSRDLVRRAERDGVRVEAPTEREQAIEAIADALGRGVPPTAIEELSRRVGGASRATMARLDVGAQVTADLVAMRVSPQEAVETVGAALAQGFGVRDIVRLRERLAQELKRGRAPDDGAARLRDEIRTERPEPREGSPEKDPSRDRPGRDREGPGGGRPGRR